MKNKKAWIRIFEAVIAVMLLVTVVLVLISKYPEKTDFSSSMYKLQHAILKEASRDSTVRGDILDGEPYNVVRTFIDERMEAFPGLNWDFSICPATETCAKPINIPEKRDLYVDDIIITNGINKKIVFYVWI